MEKAFEPADLFSCRDDLLDGLGADPFDGRKAETNKSIAFFVMPGIFIDHGKIGKAFIDIRRQDLDAHIFALGDVIHHLVGIAHFITSAGRPCIRSASRPSYRPSDMR